MNYITFDRSPILQQVSTNFHSAAILLHPFVEMPANWGDNKKTHPHEHVYPTIKEQLTLGRPVPWHEIMKKTGLNSYQEVAISLMTSILAFTPVFANENLAKRLNNSLPKDLYYPTEDTTSIFLYEKIIQLLKNTGTTTIKYYDPIRGINGSLNISLATPKLLANIAERECLITDEDNTLAFISIFDAFTTIMLYKQKDIENLASHFEHIICDRSTQVDWYFQD